MAPAFLCQLVTMGEHSMPWVPVAVIAVGHN
jgi:hypothetical protein